MEAANRPLFVLNAIKPVSQKYDGGGAYLNLDGRLYVVGIASQTRYFTDEVIENATQCDYHLGNKCYLLIMLIFRQIC
jgi:hypothetical protein